MPDASVASGVAAGNRGSVLELKWLLDFVSLANTGNFSRSAEERSVTQSAFSRRIQSLENWVGAELIDRTTHPVSLTDSGIRFLNSANYMIQLANGIQDDFRDRRAADRDLIAFSSSTNLAITFLPSWLTRIFAEFGEFNATVQTDISGIHDHFETLRSRQSDFLVHYGHGVEMLAMDASKFDNTVIGHDVLVPVCHRSLKPRDGYLLPQDSGVPVPYLSPWRTSSIANAIAKKIAESHPYTRLDTRVESSIVGCTKGFVAEGAGIAWLPRSIIGDELASGEFALAADESYEVPLSIQLYRYSASTKPIALRFWDYVAAMTA